MTADDQDPMRPRVYSGPAVFGWEKRLWRRWAMHRAYHGWGRRRGHRKGYKGFTLRSWRDGR